MSSALLVPLVRVELSTADDPECGISVALFVAGCRHRCLGCQNPELQTTQGFKFQPIEDVISRVRTVVDRSGGLVDSVVFLGGDWMLYQNSYLRVTQWARGRSLKTVLYTGEKYEDLSEAVRQASEWVIDGDWRQDLPGVYPASTNQRVFHRGQLTSPESLPLFQHLMSLQENREATSV